MKVSVVSISVFILIILSCLSCNRTGKIIKSDGFVHAAGKRIAEGNGSEIILKGVGLGGWMLQEGYMLDTQGAQHEIREFLEGLAGKSATDKFYEDWLNYFVAKKDIEQIADWGYNSVRLPMHYNLYLNESGQWLENSKGLMLTDNLIEWCKAEGLYVILDLHAAPGGQGNNQDISDRRDGESLWTSDEAQEMTRLFWYKIADYYKDETIIAGYDLLNEPNYDFENTGNSKGCTCQKNEPLLKLYEQLIDTIRAVDKNHLLIIEGNCYGSNYNGLESLANYDPQKNLALSFHNYWSPNTTASTQKMLDLRNELKVPLWRGEIGENSNTWFTEMVESMESLEIGYANWPWKKINDLDGPVIIKNIPEWDRLIAYKADPNFPKPSQSEAQTALEKMITNLKIENCILMHDVAYAYLNSPYGEGIKPYNINNIPGIIYPTDYDYGKWGESWYDTDYQNISGRSSNTAWNKGGHYRNDGVDIWPTEDEFTNGFYVGKIENGEWLSFTINNIQEGNYKLSFRVKSEEATNGEIDVYIDGKVVKQAQINIGETNKWEDIIVSNVQVPKGEKLKVLFKKGGFDFSRMVFTLLNK